MERGAHALGTSLVHARLGIAAQPIREQQLLEQLQAAAGDVGCLSREWITALYLGLKLHWRVVVCGPAREHAMACFDALVRALAGGQRDQALHIHGPIGADQMSRRFAALRIAEFVGALGDPLEQGKAWFLLVDVPGAATATLRWIEDEVAAAMPERVRGTPGALPTNLFVVAAASESDPSAPRRHLSLRAPHWELQPRHGVPRPSLPVGYQRYLLKARLTAAEYRLRLRRGGEQSAVDARAAKLGLRREDVQRWLIASVDQYGHGLWVADDAAANARVALDALERLALAPTAAG